MRARKAGGLVVVVSASIAATAAVSTHTVVAGPTGLHYAVTTVGDYGGEPSMVSDSNGVLYIATPQGGMVNYRSSDRGLSWHKNTTPDPSSGDDCLGVDQSNAVYMCNLAGSDTAPLQADVWKTTDKGATWTEGAGIAPGCAASCSPFGVDRDWVDASIMPPNTSTSQAEVVLMYHDFYGPVQIWVNISTDGGKTYGAPTDVLASPAVTPGAVAGTLEAQGYSFCNTVPAGVGIVRPGLPHAGRIYVGWIAADLPQNATGCNVSMLQSFHTIWISYSDDNGATWTPQQVFDGGIGHDTSTPFVGFTLDDRGNPYFAFASQGPSANPVVCAAESTAGTVQSDTSCQYNMYVVWSKDGGNTWDDGNGLIPGSASVAYQVNPSSETGTHFYPAIAAHDPGQVDVAYFYSPTILPTDPFGKADPGGCAGPGPANGNPVIYPPACVWNLYAGQSLDLTKDTSTATWTTARVTPQPMHIGDICNLGIFCVDPNSNRNLLDFIQMAIDPTTGCAHIAYPDDNTVNKLRVANQTTGCFAVAAATQTPVATTGTPAPTPAGNVAAATGANGTPNTAAIGPAGAGAAAGVALLLAVVPATMRRRRRRLG